ncbi:MAG: hypothetical protein HY079_09670 [Elusimicrobia bacterium]|nr:hypothetical protein [Elusimicrobiota bacterium]
MTYFWTVSAKPTASDSCIASVSLRSDCWEMPTRCQPTKPIGASEMSRNQKRIL